MEMNIIWLVLILSSPSLNQCALLLTPTLQSYPIVYGAYTSSVITPTQQQYHTQDGYGQYAYGYSDHLSAKQEVRRYDGLTQGSYSYVDPDGYLQSVDYTADKNGFRVAATNLPKAPTEAITISKSPSITPIASITPITPITPVTASSNTVPGSIQSVGSSGNAISTASGLRMASGTTVNRKPTPDTSNVRPVELPNTLADTAKVTPNSGLYIKPQSQSQSQSHSILVPSNIDFVHYPKLATPLIPKTYTWAYPTGKYHLYNSNYFY